jgi:hypothetical protein
LLPISLCAQNEYTIPLKGADSSLAVPELAVNGNGTLYIAYRSFNLLKRSSKLQLVAYDLNKHKELGQAMIFVPEVHGARVSDGLYISKDGQLLSYAEGHDPSLVLLMSTKDLSEIRRSTLIPFTSDDKQRSFAGFDNEGLLSFASDNKGGLRFLRIAPSNLKTVSDVVASGLHQERSQRIVWSPAIKRVWTYKPGLGSDAWQEYSEAGKSTGQGLSHRNGLPYGAVALGEGKLLAFYGNLTAKGTVISYSDHHTAELNLECLPHPYGNSDDPEYAGTICATSPDREPENGGNQILSSEFLLLRTREPSVLWRQKMDYVDIAEKDSGDVWFHQVADPIIYRSGNTLWTIALSKPSELRVYEVELPNR